MKNSILILLVAVGTMMSCNKNFEKVKIQNHDKNEMMKIMHTMMDEMSMMTMTKDPNVDFSMMMKMHHEGAIAMAQFEVEHGDDTEMKAIAQNVILAQQAEIAEFNVLIADLVADTSIQAFSDKMMACMTKMDQASDLQVIIGDADYDFASLMIVHHQNAIDMSEIYLEYGTHQELIIIAEKIITDQTTEIEALQTWLLANKEY